MAVVPLATHVGLGADYGQAPRPVAPSPAAIAGVSLAAVAVGWWAAALALVMAVSIVAVRWLAMRKIGGISGDVLGAVRTGGRVPRASSSLTGLASHHPLWWT